jgi:hypothetical protein
MGSVPIAPAAVSITSSAATPITPTTIAPDLTKSEVPRISSPGPCISIPVVARINRIVSVISRTVVGCRHWLVDRCILTPRRILNRKIWSLY